ncbi:superinfection immunity protein [Roseiconus lacunae]|uniref:superinfection immunity protein n=1 Tax=Roseiconus lacunae TaxID=2605694 RepID=UPI001E291246|nr:superinfection immunity protein [Roseiconus lacunae]
MQIPEIKTDRNPRNTEKTSQTSLLGLEKKFLYVEFAAMGIYGLTASFLLLAFTVSLASPDRDFSPGSILLGVASSTVLGPLAAVIFCGVFCMPTLIAMYRNHRNVVPLAIANFVFGWTGLGWIVCVAWSFWQDGPAEHAGVVNTVYVSAPSHQPEPQSPPATPPPIEPTHPR